MAATLSLLTNISTLMRDEMKLHWLTTVEGSAFWERVGKKHNSKNISNNTVVQPAFSTDGYGMRYLTSEGGSLPTPLNLDGEVLASYSLASQFNRMAVSGNIMDEGMIRGAVGTYEKLNIESFINSNKHFYELMWYGHANSTLCKVTKGYGEGAAADQLTVDDPTRLRLNQIIDITDDTIRSAVHGNSVKITAIDYVTGVITISGTITSVVAGDYVSYEDSCQATAIGMAGFSDVISNGTTYTCNGVEFLGTTTYAGLTRSSTNHWSSYIKAYEGGINPSGKLLANHLSKAKKVHGKTPEYSAVYCSPEVAAHFAEVIPVEQRYMNDEQVAFGVYSPVVIRTPFNKSGKLTLIPMDACKPYCAYFVNEADFEAKCSRAPGWMEEKDGTFWRYDNTSSGTDAYYATWGSRFGLVAHPNEHSAIFGINHISLT